MGWFSDIVDAIVDTAQAVYDWLVGKIEEIEETVDDDFGTCPVADPTQPCPGPQTPPALGGLVVQVVKESDQTPVQGATVRVSGPEVREVVTGADGLAPFEPLLEGHYVVEVAASGYDPKQSNGTVVENQTSQTKVALKSGVPINPLVLPGTPVVVLVKRPLTTPRRVELTLKADKQMVDGTGTLSTSKPTLKFFDAATAGNEIPLDGVANVFSNTKINAGVHVWAEGAAASTANEDTEIIWALAPNTQSPGPAVKVKATAVELVLEICKSRTAPAADPVALTDAEKADPGRFIHVQDPGNNHGRALMRMRRAKPKDFAGTLELKAINAKVNSWSADTAGVATVLPFTMANTAISEANGALFWVQGAAASGALRDTGFTLGVQGGDPEGDKVLITVVNMTKIAATIKPTPANTARAGFAAPANHAYSSTSYSEDFAVNTPLVLMRNSQTDVALEVTCVPADVPVTWVAVRNTADHATLGGEADLPTVTKDAGNPYKSTLNTNNKGSFQIRPIVDANGTGKFEDKEPSIPLNLVLANATMVNDKNIGNVGALVSGFNGAGTSFSVSNGVWPGTHRNPTNGDLAAAGMAMEIDADVTGGGADGKLGLDMVFGGYVNDLRDVRINASYTDNTVAPPTNHRFNNVYVSNAAAATGAMGTTPMFLTGDPAPTPYSFPLLDTGRSPNGDGGENATMTRSYPQVVTARPVGERWNLRCIDSPGRGIPVAHPVNANALITSLDYTHGFEGCFAFWTNVTKVRSPSGDSADRLYAVVNRLRWECRAVWSFTHAGGGAAPVANATTAHTVTWTSTKLDPIARAQDQNLEVRPPSGITSVIAWDVQ